MKTTGVKAMVAKGLTVGLLAGAFVLAGPVQAEAQQFAVGVQFGQPNFYHDDDRHYDHDRDRDSYRDQARREYEERVRFEQERRQEEWVRAHEYARYHHEDRDEDGYRGRWEQR